MDRTKKIIIGLTLLAAVSALATLLSPVPGDLFGVTPVQFRTDVALSFFFGLLYVAGGYLFTLGLTGFTNKLRSIYLTICAGMVVLGLTFLQLPVISMLDAWTEPWATSGAVGVPFVLAGLILFWGIHNYAKLINVRTIWSNWFIALGLAV